MTSDGVFGAATWKSGDFLYRIPLLGLPLGPGRNEIRINHWDRESGGGAVILPPGFFERKNAMAILKNGGTATRLADSQKSLEGLEACREVLVREHQSSVEDFFFFKQKTAYEIKLLSKADSRVAAAE